MGVARSPMTYKMLVHSAAAYRRQPHPPDQFISQCVAPFLSLLPPLPHLIFNAYQKTCTSILLSVSMPNSSQNQGKGDASVLLKQN